MAHISHCDYSAHIVGKGNLVYCDPPYADTGGYNSVKKSHGFDDGKFWLTMDQWVENGATVVVSELTSPSWWKPFAQIEKVSTLRYSEVRTEKLFVHESILG